MGRLSYLKSNKLRRALLGWALPLLVAGGILFGVHTQVQADPAPSKVELQAYLENNQLNAFVAIGNEYPQIYYNYNRQPITITRDNYPHLHPVVSGRYIAWQGVINGLSQIFLYDVLTESLIQLSSASVNEDPYVYQNTVVWQAWDGQHWQIYYYDGTEVNQITDNPTSSVRSSTNGNQIIYAEQVGRDEWKAQSYDIDSGEVTTIRQGDTASTGYPQFTDDGIATAFVPF